MRWKADRDALIAFNQHADSQNDALKLAAEVLAHTITAADRELEVRFDRF